MFPSGEYIHPAQLAWFPVLIPGIKEIFFLQYKDYSLDVYVVKEENGDSNKIIKGIDKRIGQLSKDKKNKLKYSIIFKDNIQRKSRKHRIVETKVESYKEFF